jgi:hypothetical protein
MISCVDGTFMIECHHACLGCVCRPAVILVYDCCSAQTYKLQRSAHTQYPRNKYLVCLRLGVDTLLQPLRDTFPAPAKVGTPCLNNRAVFLCPPRCVNFHDEHKMVLGICHAGKDEDHVHLKQK